MIYCFDLDGTLCTKVDKNKYELAQPIPIMVDHVNSIYDAGNIVKIFTARGASSGIDWTDLTKKQLNLWNIKHHKLLINSKPSYDYFIDDKAYNVEHWKSHYVNIKRGIIAGSFDIIHPGYIQLFKQAKNVCNHLTVLLHDNPSVEKPNKISPILTVAERKEILLSIRYIDDIITYSTEKELEILLTTHKFDIRILGDDYVNKNYTGKELCQETIFIDRSHHWSTTKFKTLLWKQINDRSQI